MMFLGRKRKILKKSKKSKNTVEIMFTLELRITLSVCVCVFVDYFCVLSCVVICVIVSMCVCTVMHAPRGRFGDVSLVYV